MLSTAGGRYFDITHNLDRDDDDDDDGVLCGLDVLIITANRLPAQLSLSLARDHSKFVGRARDTSISIEMHRLDVLYMFSVVRGQIYICCTHHHTICNIHTRHTHTTQNHRQYVIITFARG